MSSPIPSSSSSSNTPPVPSSSSSSQAQSSPDLERSGLIHKVSANQLPSTPSSSSSSQSPGLSSSSSTNQPTRSSSEHSVPPGVLRNVVGSSTKVPTASSSGAEVAPKQISGADLIEYKKQGRKLDGEIKVLEIALSMISENDPAQKEACRNLSLKIERKNEELSTLLGKLEGSKIKPAEVLIPPRRNFDTIGWEIVLPVDINTTTLKGSNLSSKRLYDLPTSQIQILMEHLRKPENVQTLRQFQLQLNQDLEQSFAPAQNFVGHLYELGFGRLHLPLSKVDNKNYNIAAAWYGKSVMQWHPEAQYNVGRMLESGKGFRINKELAAQWYMSAIASGVSNAYFDLGRLYQSGEGVEKNDVIAFALYKMGAEAGDVRAAYQLGNSYQSGVGVTPDVELASKWFTVAAERGNLLQHRTESFWSEESF